MMNDASNGKRKATSTVETPAAAHHQCKKVLTPILMTWMKTSIGPPRFISPDITEGHSTEDTPCFASLPREIFYNIVAYLGPTSSSLCTLCQVSREHNSLMTCLGDVMLHRATLRYRTPLPAKSPCESSISLFVRHARVSKAIKNSLEVLDSLMKNFPSMDNESYEDLKELSIEPQVGLTFPSTMEVSGTTRQISQTTEVLNALNIALFLLGCKVHHLFDNANDPKEATKTATKTALERRVSNLCSKIGAKAYDFAKSRRIRRHEREDQLFSAISTGMNDRYPEDESESDEDEDDEDISIDLSEQEADEDRIILDRACLVMQYVVLRQQQNATYHYR